MKKTIKERTDEKFKNYIELNPYDSDNIYIGLSIDRKIKREVRMDVFVEEYLPKFKTINNIKIEFIDKTQCFYISLNDIEMKFYPKANSIFIEGRKIEKGLKWLKTNLKANLTFKDLVF